MRLVLDGTAQRLDGGRVLVGGSPLTAFRLGEAGKRVIDAIAGGRDVPAAARPLVDRLLDTGAAHPRPAGERYSADDVTVVIPVFGLDPRSTLAAVGPAAATLVVDDGSTPPVAAPGPGLLRHHVNQGPAAARMTGAIAVTTPLVAFLDADCEPTPGWLEPLLAHFDDDRIALVAPRIVTARAERAVARRDVLTRYDSMRNPLDLGPVEGRVAPTTRISYVPAAAILVRLAALEAVGGFDRTLRVGEDVDLVWRLVQQGWRCRYEPRSVVGHRARATLLGLVRQRFRYGSAAAALDARHRNAVAPAIVGPWAGGGWAAAALGHPLAGAALGMVPAITLRRALSPFPGRERLALRLAALGLVRAGEQLASSTTRVWWPAALLAGVLCRRLRAPLAAAAVVPALIDWVRTARPKTGAKTVGLDPGRYVALRLLDDASYGAGVWRGAIEARDAGALLPRFSLRPLSAGSSCLAR